MSNRLQHETSPYLLQHRDNPVDWFAWGDEALQKARDENRPILLSVGYSACHWCHVMAHESFEDPATAELMNELYVNVKVDREERPDVDAIYMDAVQALTGSGGWPMTVFLLPDGRPFYGGTYFPPSARYGVPAFKDILTGVHDAYENRRDEVEKAADNLTRSLDRSVMAIGGKASDLNVELLDTALQQMLRNVDQIHGGLGGAPKFPQPMNLEFLLRSYIRTGNADVLKALKLTLTKMARGGIYDQLGGGFARYSVDAYWLVPHFEKMLYDNAQLSRLYLHTWQTTGDPFFRDIAVDIYDYVLREMTNAGGGFYSATDADSEGEEGKFFVWSIQELKELLTEQQYHVAVEYWGVTRGGNFEGKNILYVPNDDAVVAERLDMTVEGLRESLNDIRDVLYAARAQRVHPGLDDKVLASWNGLMVASLAEAARVLDRDDYMTAAIRAGEYLLEALRIESGSLLRTTKDGQSKIDAFLEDYANMIDALLELYQSTFDVRWFNEARALAEYVLAHFAAEGGGFFDTGDEHEVLIVRPRNAQDNAVPSGNSMIAKQLLRLAAYTGEARYEEAAVGTLRLLTEALKQYPQAFGEALNAVDMLVTGISEIAIVGNSGTDSTDALMRVLVEIWRPNIVIAQTQEPVAEENPIPLLHYRTMRQGQPTAYVCQKFTCQMPVTNPDELRGQLVS